MLRLKEIRKENKKSQEELAKLLGVTQATLSGWENEKYEIDNKSLITCAELFNVSVDYLLGLSDEQGETASNGKKIPVLGNVAAGLPISAVENILDYEEISEDMARTGEFFGLRIKGNSMEPRIKEGDVVIVKQQDDVESGQVAIVLINGDDATCKKFVKHDNGISLVSYNPSHPPMFFTPEEIETKPIRVIGRVVELRAKF